MPDPQTDVIQRVTVFTGSKHGNVDAYVDAVEAFARAVADRGLGIVFGGGDVGLMGVVADAALAAGAQVHGIIPESMLATEVPHQNLTQLEIVSNMHARKHRMAELGQAFVAMPGGIGTLEEFFEIWTWQQLGLHVKPVALLNAAGFWDPLLAMIDHMAAQGFVRRSFTDALIVESTPDALLDALMSWQPPVKQTPAQHD